MWSECTKVWLASPKSRILFKNRFSKCVGSTSVAGFFSETMSGSNGRKKQTLKTYKCCSWAPSQPWAPSRPSTQPTLQGIGWSWFNSARQCLTLLFQLIDVSHDGSEKGSLVGVIVHAASHKVSQLLTRWCHWPAPAFVESFFFDQRLVFQGDLAVVADFPECCSKAPLVSGHTQVLGVFDTFGSNPWDSFNALCKKTADIYRSV